jgi:hypothetical protein
MYDPKEMIEAGFIYEGIGRNGAAVQSRGAHTGEPRASELALSGGDRRYLGY